jgi:hypothetical protein
MLKIPQIIAKNLDDLFVVGGAVRDLLLGKTPKEFDLITKSSLKSLPFRTYGESRNDQTVGAYIKGIKYDISFYESLEDDLKRRDFTVNSMAIPVDHDGGIDLSKIIDPCDGTRDLKNKILRSFNPFENMKADPVRIIRGLRFISEYDLDVEDSTLRSMKEVFPSIIKTSKERIFPPLNAFIRGTYFSKAASIAKYIDVERYLSLPSKNLSIAKDVDPECRLPAIFFETGKIDEFAVKVFPPKNVVRKISRICDFGDQILNKRYEWTVKISPQEATCLIELFESSGLDPAILKDRMRIKLNLQPADLVAMGVTGKDISECMIELWRGILTRTFTNEKNILAEEISKIMDRIHTEIKGSTL